MAGADAVPPDPPSSAVNPIRPPPNPSLTAPGPAQGAPPPLSFGPGGQRYYQPPPPPFAHSAAPGSSGAGYGGAFPHTSAHTGAAQANGRYEVPHAPPAAAEPSSGSAAHSSTASAAYEGRATAEALASAPDTAAAEEQAQAQAYQQAQAQAQQYQQALAQAYAQAEAQAQAQAQAGTEAGAGLDKGRGSEGTQAGRDPGVPVPILNAAPREPRDPFQGLKRTEDGKALYAADLDEDLRSGEASSAPFVDFTSSMVCNQMRVTNTASLGFGAMVSPAPSSPASLPCVRRRPNRCERCGAYANLYCALVPNTGEWRCPFCATRNTKGSEYAVQEGHEFAQWPELKQRGVDYLEANLGPARPDAPSPAGGAPAQQGPSPALILVLDECLDAPAVSQLQASLQEVLSKLPPGQLVGFVSYSASVALYDLAQPTLARADTFPGTASPSAATLSALRHSSAVYLAPIHTCLPAAQAVVASLRPSRRAPESQGHPQPRCLGAALELALALVRQRRSRRGNSGASIGIARIVVACAGPITLGPHAAREGARDSETQASMRKAAKGLEALGKEAREANTTIDILYHGAYGVPQTAGVMLALTANSGGAMMLLDSFSPASLAANALRAATRGIGHRGFIELRTSKSVALSRVIGPALELSRREAAEVLAFGRPEEYFPGDTASVLEMVGTVDEGQAVTLSLEMTSDEPRDFIFFQVAFRYVDANQSIISRVVTLRLPTTGNPHKYLASVHEDSAAVMMGKRTALSAASAEEALEQRTWVEARAKDLAIKLGKPVPRSRMLHFPNELPRVIEALYFLRRGPLLATPSPDGAEDAQRLILRHIFLRAAPEAALRMVVPRLLMFQPGRPPREVPPADLALRSDVALLLDLGTDLIIWTGSELGGDRLEAVKGDCQRVVSKISARRFPVPCTHFFPEGSQEAMTVLLPMLMPASKDPLAQQELRFPPLREMLPDERARLKAKKLPASEESFCEWLRRLSLVAPDPSQ